MSTSKRQRRAILDKIIDTGNQVIFFRDLAHATGMYERFGRKAASLIEKYDKLDAVYMAVVEQARNSLVAECQLLNLRASKSPLAGDQRVRLEDEAKFLKEYADSLEAQGNRDFELRETQWELAKIEAKLGRELKL